MKKEILFGVMLLMTSAIFVSCSQGGEVPLTPPPGYQNGGGEEISNGTASADEHVNINELRQQIDFPRELVLPHAGVVMALKAKEPGKLRYGDVYLTLHNTASWLRMEADGNGIYFQANSYSETPATIKIHRQAHPEEAIEFTVRVANNDELNWNIPASGHEINVSYKGGAQTLTLKNNFGCTLTELFSQAPDWLKVTEETALTDGCGVAGSYDVKANYGNSQRIATMNVSYKKFSNTGFYDVSMGSLMIVQDVALTLQSSATVDESKTISLNYTNNTSSNVEWYSSDNSIATVSGGIVRGISKGTAVISAFVMENDNTWKQTCKVTVRSASDVAADVINKVSIGVGIQNGRYGVFINNNLPGSINVSSLTASGATSFSGTNLGTVAAGGTGFIAHSFNRGTTTIRLTFTYQGQTYTKSTTLTLS